MSFSYAVDLELAAKVVASLSTVDEHLSEVVVDLRWRVARLHETWAGTAAAAHLVAHDSWCASYAEMHDALLAMRAAVTHRRRQLLRRGLRQRLDVGFGPVILIDAAPLVDASSSFEHGNQSAALVHDTLLRRLSDCGAMAGDASIAEEFASAYDDAASSCLAAVGDLVDAFTTCGRLTAACLDNHGHAENRSLISGRTVFTGTPCVAGYVVRPPLFAPLRPGWRPLRTALLGRVDPRPGRGLRLAGRRHRPAARRRRRLARRVVPGRRPLGVLLLGDPLVLPAPLPRGPGRRRGHLRPGRPLPRRR